MQKQEGEVNTKDQTETNDRILSEPISKMTVDLSAISNLATRHIAAAAEIRRGLAVCSRASSGTRSALCAREIPSLFGAVLAPLRESRRHCPQPFAARRAAAFKETV